MPLPRSQSVDGITEATAQLEPHTQSSSLSRVLGKLESVSHIDFLSHSIDMLDINSFGTIALTFSEFCISQLIPFIGQRYHYSSQNNMSQNILLPFTYPSYNLSPDLFFNFSRCISYLYPVFTVKATFLAALTCWKSFLEQLWVAIFLHFNKFHQLLNYIYSTKMYYTGC